MPWQIVSFLTKKHLNNKEFCVCMRGCSFLNQQLIALGLNDTASVQSLKHQTPTLSLLGGIKLCEVYFFSPLPTSSFINLFHCGLCCSETRAVHTEYKLQMTFVLALDSFSSSQSNQKKRRPTKLKRSTVKLENLVRAPGGNARKKSKKPFRTQTRM